MNLTKIGFPAFIVFVLFGIFSCARDTSPTPPGVLLKDYNLRVQLGSAIAQSILEDEENFSVLPHNIESDSIYQYLQAAYNQVTTFLKHDGNPETWDSSRVWKVNILNDTVNKSAFTIPGGDIYITTGLLKAFAAGKEIYYVMAYESVIMNEGILAKSLIEEFTTGTLVEVAQGVSSSNGVNVQDVVTHIKNLKISEVDEGSYYLDDRTIEEICQSSNVEPDGIRDIIDYHLSPNDIWIANRVQNNLRSSEGFIIDLQTDDCLESNDDPQRVEYETFVLNVLD